MYLRTENGIRKMLAQIGATWTYTEGSPIHAKLTGGMHSDHYLNCARLVQHPALVADVVTFLLNKSKVPTFGYFVGVAEGSITLANECARQRRTGFAYAQKSGKEMVFDRFTFAPHSTAVVVEDVITTAGSVQKTIRALRALEVTPYRKVLCLANGSGTSSFTDDSGTTFDIVSVMEETGKDYHIDECPMCRAGSLPITPKNNWDEFMKAL